MGAWWDTRELTGENVNLRGVQEGDVVGYDDDCLPRTLLASQILDNGDDRLDDVICELALQLRDETGLGVTWEECMDAARRRHAECGPDIRPTEVV